MLRRGDIIFFQYMFYQEAYIPKRSPEYQRLQIHFFPDGHLFEIKRALYRIYKKHIDAGVKDGRMVN